MIYLLFRENEEEYEVMFIRMCKWILAIKKATSTAVYWWEYLTVPVKCDNIRCSQHEQRKQRWFPQRYSLVLFHGIVCIVHGGKNWQNPIC